ncbi:MAG: hypothetical protein QOH15_1521 [Gaiellales bacterium]|nr:hypothetical protein [Gaiellales bacterium]
MERLGRSGEQRQRSLDHSAHAGILERRGVRLAVDPDLRDPHDIGVLRFLADEVEKAPFEVLEVECRVAQEGDELVALAGVGAEPRLHSKWLVHGAKDATMAGVDGHHPSARLFDVMSGMMRTQTIAAIAGLGVADAIAAGVTGTDELAREVGADRDALYRMLRLLEADGLVSQDAPGVWRLSEVGELLREGVEGSMRQQALLFGAELYEAWAGATTSLRTGEPVFAAHFGSLFFEWLQQHPLRARSFDRAMSGTATLRMAPLLELDWDGVETVVDVGGGNGMLIEALLERVPGVRGSTFDLPHVSERAASRLEKNTALAGRVSAEAGDFFEAVPPAADVYVLAQVLHDWSDHDCVRILEVCRRASRSSTRLLVLEQVLPEGPEPNVAKLTDLNMLVLLGGRERTRREFEVLLAAGGWSLIGHHPGPRWSALEGIPARR